MEAWLQALIREEERWLQRELPSFENVGASVAEELTRVRVELFRTQKTIERLRFPAVEILDFEGFRGDLQKIRAELEALKQAHKTEKGEEAQRELIIRLLGVLDAFDRFEETATSARAQGLSPDTLRWLDGFDGIMFIFREAMHSFGLKPMKTVGEKFDPTIHTAVGTVPSGKFPPGYVAEEKRKGYYYGGRAIRPAEVVVIKGS
ncbi:MAG: nucleotide exchange factor GrpE [bacterium JZ-2024 1]